MNPSVLETSLRDLITVVFKRKWSILSIFVVTIVVATVYVFIVRDSVYEAEAVILVKIGQEQASPSTVLGDQPMVVGQRVDYVNSEVAILTSTQLLEQVVDTLDLDQPGTPEPRPSTWFAALRYDAKRLKAGVRDWINDLLISMGVRERLSFREQAVYLLSRGLRVNPVPHSHVLIATLKHKNRHAATLILNELLDIYVVFRMKVHESATAIEFFEGQISEARANLEQAQMELRDYENASGILALAPQKTTLVEQVAAARARVHESFLALQAAAQKVELLAGELATEEADFALLGEFVPESFPETLQEQLAVLQREREQLRMTDLDDSPRIRSNRAQFREMVNLMASYLQSVAHEKLEIHEANVSELEALQGDLARLHDAEAQWMALERQVRLLDQDYTFIQKKLQESRAVGALDRSNVRNVEVVQYATDPLIPVGVRKTTLLAITLILAVLAAGGWAAVAEFFDHRVYSAEQLEQQLQAPVMAVVPVDRRVRIKR